MTKSELLEALKQEVSSEEYKNLRERRIPHLSEYNRQTMLELLSRTNVPSGDVSSDRVAALRTTLERYLAIYLADAKDSWKWIILPCIYLSFICNLPLHPREIVHYTITAKHGQVVYHCPMKSAEEGTACAFCVCERP